MKYRSFLIVVCFAIITKSTFSQIGIGTTSPVTELQIYSPNESTTLTNFTQALGNGGLLIQTNYTPNTYTPGLFWSTSNDNNTKPKAGIFLFETASGTQLHFGTSNNYSTGITNTSFMINPIGNATLGNGKIYGESRLSLAGTNGNNDATLTTAREDGTTNPVFSILPWSSQVYLSAGIYYSNGAWSHHSDDGNNQLFILDPGGGVRWYTSNNGSGSWNLASNETLWDDGGNWKNLIQSSQTGDSYFIGGNLGIGNTSPQEKLHVTGSIRMNDANETAGDIMTSDANGVASWVTPASLGLGDGIYGGDGTTPGDVDVTVTDDIDFDGGTFFIDGTNNKIGIGTTSPTEVLEVAGWIGRSAHNNGGLCGSYNNVGANSTSTNPIYVIGWDYKPNSTALNNMHGTGFSHTNASFINLGSGGASWGHYIAADGDARVWLGASATGNSYFNTTGNFGFGTNAPVAKFHVTEPDESATLTDFTQALTKGGILVETNYSDGTYTPGLFWSTSDNNATKPKAGIFLRQTGANGTYMHFGTSGAYATGITSSNVAIDPFGRLGVGTGIPAAKLEVQGSADEVQMIVKANGTQTIINPLIQLQNSVGTPIMEINSNTSSNVFIGVDAGDAITSGTQNTLIGSGTGSLLSTGANNTTLGFQAGSNLTLGSNNIIIGSGNTAISPTGNNQLDIGDVIYGDLSSKRISIGTISLLHKVTSVVSTSNNVAALYGQNSANGTGNSYAVWGRQIGNGATLTGHAFYGEATGATNTNYGIYNTVSGGTSFNYGTRAVVSGGAFSYGFFGTINSGTTSNRGVYLTASGASTLGNIGVYASADGSTTNTNHGVWGNASGGGTNNYGLYGQASGATNNYGLYVASGETVISDAGTTVPTRSITGSIGLAAVGGSGRIYYRANGGFYFVNHSGFGDYSEYFRRSDQTLEVGDIVAIDFNDHNAVRKADAAHGDGQRIMGIVSKYGTRNNDDTDGLRHSDSNYVNIGLLGQVQLKVSTENGVIQPGDALTLSPSQSGVAVKATKSCRIIGFSMTHYPYVEEEETYPTHTGTNKEDENLDVPHVMVYVHAGHWAGQDEKQTNSKIKELEEKIELLLKQNVQHQAAIEELKKDMLFQSSTAKK